MTGRSHTVISSFTTLAIGVSYLNIISLWAFALGGMFATLPDIDCMRHQKRKYRVLSILIIGAVATYFLNGAFSLYFIFLILIYFTKHRTWSHSLLAILITYYLLTTGAASLGYKILGTFATIGYALHILEDMITVEGVPLLYPISKTKFKIPLMKVGKTSGTIVENICIVGSIIICMYLIYEKVALK